MGLQVLLAIAIFGALGAAMWLFLVACAVPGAADAVPRRRAAADLLARVMTPCAAMAGGAGLLVAAVTRWPVAALVAVALVWWWPALVGGGTAAASAIDRLEALAGWTESLKDTIAGAIGLEEAIPASAVAAAEPIQPHVAALVERLRAREPLPAALGRFATDLDDPSADLVVAALVLNSQLRGPGLRATLEALAASARDELDLRRRIEAGRRALRTGVRIIVGVTVGFVAVLASLDSGYLDPYDTATGQVVLAVVAGVFGLAFWWLRALSRAVAPDRLIALPARGSAEASR
jgi:Flp pilus assembly protein TadB